MDFWGIVVCICTLITRDWLLQVKMRSLCRFQLVVLLGFGLSLLLCSAFTQTEIFALNDFKEAIYEDPLLALSNWNALDSDPCDWFGISCSIDKDHVVKINISGASLKGFLSPNVYMLSFLQELVLHDNLLIGTIPKEICMLNNLTVLDLGVNQLTGPIPPGLGNLSNIMKINLQSNGLTGRLPPELGELKYLEELRLDRNKLQGTVPASNGSEYQSNMHGMYVSSSQLTGLCRSSKLKAADFSYNFFVGNIPKCLEYVRSSFQGNCLNDKDPIQRPSAQCGSSSLAKSHSGDHPEQRPVADRPKRHVAASKPTWLLALEIGTGVMVGCLILVAFIAAVQKCKSKSAIIIPWKKSGSGKDYLTVYIDSEMLKDVAKYSRQELEIACEDFSNIIGSSPDSNIYKGTIKGGPEISVISLCVKEEHWTGYLELYFQKEVADLARLNHENAGNLLGYCRESSPFTRMLVFEYASNGTLHEHLHYGDGCQLSWTRRMKIAIGIAKGLKYLHAEIDPPFSLSQLNSNAVYLTEDFSPKLVDFESWKTILSRSEKNAGSINNQGDICVLPSSMEGRHVDIEGNIYAFGLLLLEIISGRSPYSKEKGFIVDWAKEFLKDSEAMPHLVDTELEHFKHEDLKVICQVVNLCLHQTPNNRTNMPELCSLLENNIDTSVSAELMASSLAWAEVALSS
ncbi:hypothetical protein LIER_20754 [Lithospermum erythrorhizon]|uniref:Protein kinase domain-containing protein n=1 Tax=Lithospermum erythrorhizon TaxID=34254 RepID=A0AAV3QRR6_LITER